MVKFGDEKIPNNKHFDLYSYDWNFVEDYRAYGYLTKEDDYRRKWRSGAAFLQKHEIESEDPDRKKDNKFYEFNSIEYFLC